MPALLRNRSAPGIDAAVAPPCDGIDLKGSLSGDLAKRQSTRGKGQHRGLASAGVAATAPGLAWSEANELKWLNQEGKEETGMAAPASQQDLPAPGIPKYLNVTALTRRRKLSASTGNLHGFMAEDYSQINWPLPKMFGKEKYGYSLIDIDDPRYIEECAAMSKKLIRLSYDQQIIDLEWRKAYKALLDAEHRQATLPANCQEKTKALLKKEVDACMKYLLELQEQKDMYMQSARDVYSRCDAIKSTIKKETDLEDLRMTMERQTKEKIHGESPFWRTKFNIRSQTGSKRDRQDQRVLS